MHADHSIFLDAINGKRRLSVQFFSQREKRELVRTCAPLDFGPLRGSLDGLSRYQLWDLLGQRKPLNLALLEGDIIRMTPLDTTFEPQEIITWAFKPGAWTIARDWAEYS